MYEGNRITATLGETSVSGTVHSLEGNTLVIKTTEKSKVKKWAGDSFQARLVLAGEDYQEVMYISDKPVKLKNRLGYSLIVVTVTDKKDKSFKRGDIRVVTDIPVTIREHYDENEKLVRFPIPFRANIVDISANGLGVETLRDIPLNIVFVLELKLGATDICIPGVKVINKREIMDPETGFQKCFAYGCSIASTNGEKDIRAIRQYVYRHQINAKNRS